MNVPATVVIAWVDKGNLLDSEEAYDRLRARIKRHAEKNKCEFLGFDRDTHELTFKVNDWTC